MVPKAKDTIERMEGESAGALAEAENLRDAARLEHLHLWKMEKKYLCTCKKMERKIALAKARRIKAKNLGMWIKESAKPDQWVLSYFSCSNAWA